MQPADRDLSLSELGEFRTIAEVIEPALAATGVAGERGDDAGTATTSGGDEVVVTCDVAPKPAIWELLEDPWETWGWYGVAGSVSDLAAAGSAPLAIVTSLEAPRTMPTESLSRFCSGLGAACTELGLQHIGGNVREAADFACHSTVIGEAAGSGIVKRSGCRDGDVVAVLGPLGEFAAAYFTAMRSGLRKLDACARDRLIRPRPLASDVAALRVAGVELKAASDNSDGLLGALWNVAERSGCRIRLELSTESLSDAVRTAADSYGLQPLRLALMWGDWNVVVAVTSDGYADLASECAARGLPCARVGRAVAGAAGIERRVGSATREIRVLRNEAFAPWDYRTSADAAVRRIMDEPLDAVVPRRFL